MSAIDDNPALPAFLTPMTEEEAAATWARLMERAEATPSLQEDLTRPPLPRPSAPADQPLPRPRRRRKPIRPRPVTWGIETPRAPSRGPRIIGSETMRRRVVLRSPPQTSSASPAAEPEAAAPPTAPPIPSAPHARTTPRSGRPRQLRTRLEELFGTDSDDNKPTRANHRDTGKPPVVDVMLPTGDVVRVPSAATYQRRAYRAFARHQRWILAFREGTLVSARPAGLPASTERVV